MSVLPYRCTKSANSVGGTTLGPRSVTKMSGDGRAQFRCAKSAAAGFTLIELTIALVLLALISSLMFGSLSMAARSWDGGEAKVEQVSSMRQTQTFLREQIGAELPIRLKKVAELPLMFAGERDELRYAAALPTRVTDGGIWYFRLSVNSADARSPLVLERALPDLSDTKIDATGMETRPTPICANSGTGMSSVLTPVTASIKFTESGPRIDRTAFSMSRLPPMPSIKARSAPDSR